MSNKAEKHGLVSKLRFPEFREAEKWHSCPLGEITKFSSGGTPSKDVAEYWGGSIPWISASSMYETNINKSELNVTALAIGNGTRIAPKGSLLILVRGSMLFNRVPMGIATIDVAFNQDVKALEIGDGISGTFLLHQLISFGSRVPINETGIGAGKIETDDLKRLIVFLPSIQEQQKIADCLASLDDLITLEAQKLDTLKTHKKGLMQKLFPAEGETLPKLRFPGFREAGKWEEKRLSEVGSVRMCKRIFKGQTNPRGDIRFIKLVLLAVFQTHIFRKKSLKATGTIFRFRKMGPYLFLPQEQLEGRFAIKVSLPTSKIRTSFGSITTKN